MHIKKLLIIGFVWPEPKSSAAGSRMMQLIHTFLEADYQITFASPCAKSDNAFDLTSLGVSQVSIMLNDKSFDAFAKALDPNVVLFDRYMMEEQFGWRVAEHCPQALRVLDTEDLHSLRKGRQQAFKDGQEFGSHYLYSDLAKREIASIYRCDVTLIISEYEIKVLEDVFLVPKNLLLYLPFLLDTSEIPMKNNGPDFEKRFHFISIGNFLHEPNYNAVLYLKGSLWPIIRKALPQAELHVYGSYVSQKVLQLHNKNNGFLIKGFAEDAHHVMQQSRVCLAPLRFGAGLKGKLIDAMQCGTPSVMTPIASEGMFDGEVISGIIAESVNDFATAAIELYQNEDLWCDFQQKGFEVLKSRFAKEPFQKSFLDRIENLQTDLNLHRQNNFTGQMLQHHQLQSTKYMSRWIELKNAAKS